MNTVYTDSMPAGVMPNLTSSYLSNHCECRLRQSLPRVILGLVLIMLGIVSLLAPSGFSIEDSNSAVGLMTAGIVAIAVGVYFALFRNKSWVYEPTGSRVFHRSLYFSGGDKERAFHFIDTAHKADMPHPRSQGKLMLDVFSSADDSMVCMQLCEYTNFSYEPLTSPRLVTGEKARPLGRTLREGESL